MGYAQTLQQQLRRCFIKCAAITASIFLLASASSAQAPPADQAPKPTWVQSLEKNPALLAEIGRLAEKLMKNVQFPPGRSTSRLLPLVPESTMSYAAFSNYGDMANQALKILRQELQENAELRNWWRQGEMAATGARVEDFLEKVQQLSQYLGEEIVVSGAMDGRDFRPLLVAEIRKPGLKSFLAQLVKEHAAELAGLRLMDPQDLANAEEQRPAQGFLVLVRPDYVVGALDLATLRRFNARLDGTSHGFTATPFGQRIVQGYQGGLTLLLAADLQKILSQIPSGAPQAQMTFQRTGFADMKYVVWEHKAVAGREISESELSFLGPRHGVASWLAAPSNLGSLDFVSPKAMMASSVALKSPVQIFEELKVLVTSMNPNAFAPLEQMEQALGLSLKEDLLGQLGGEITAEVDSLTPPLPVWKAILRATGPSRLQQTFIRLLASANIQAEPFEEEGVTYYTARFPSPASPFEIVYAFVDGYLIIASSRQTVTEAVRLHRTGESLGKSKKFLASLPPVHDSSASALYYMNSIAFMAQSLQRAAPEMAGPFAQLAGGGEAAVVCIYGEETAIRQVSTNPSLDVGVVLVVAAIAIPNLLRSRIAANEASAVGRIRTVNTSQVVFASTYPKRGFAPDLATLGPDPRGGTAASADHADLIDSTLGNASCIAGNACVTTGFSFILTGVCKQQRCEQYVVVATPVSDSTGGRSFCSTSDGVIRSKTGPPLTSPVSVSECRAWSPL